MSNVYRKSDRVSTIHETPRKRVWDNFRVIGEVQKNERLKLVIGAGCRDGYRCIAIREFYWRKADETWVPGRDGIVIPLKAPLKGHYDADGKVKTVTPAVEALTVIAKAYTVADTMPLADPENEVWM